VGLRRQLIVGSRLFAVAALLLASATVAQAPVASAQDGEGAHRGSRVAPGGRRLSPRLRPAR
jgi:hypothetical protein